ncbi:hypothetical protein IJT93_04215 [bacterium]|nr:hypothetical protein [bacterium]
MSAAKVRRTPYGVQIIINGTLTFEEALYALEKSLEMYAVPIGQAALNLGWRDVDLKGMQRIEDLFKKTGVRLLGVISTSLTTNRAASKLGYTVVIGRVGISEYRDPAKDKHSAESENAGAAEDSGSEKEANSEAGVSAEKKEEALWTKSVEIELPADWRSHIAKNKPSQKAANVKAPSVRADIPQDKSSAPLDKAEKAPDKAGRLSHKAEKLPKMNKPSAEASKRRLPPNHDTDIDELTKVYAGILKSGKGKILLLVSGKGGVGTTCCTACLGAALAAGKKSVLLIDGNGEYGHLHKILDLEPADNRILNSDDIAELAGAELFRDRRFDSFYCLPNSSLAELIRNSSGKWFRLLVLCSDVFDFTLIDMPSLNCVKNLKDIIVAHRLIAVVNADILSVSAVDRFISLFEEDEQQKIGILINRFDSSMAKRGNCLSTEVVREMLDAEIVSVIPYDESVAAYVNQVKPFNVAGKGKAAEAFRRLADKIIDPQKEEEASVNWLQKIGLFWGGKK